MKTVIEMARIAGVRDDGHRFEFSEYKYLERFAELVRADEREKWKWDIHSCGPCCQRYACVAMREAVEAEREACAKVVEEHMQECEGASFGVGAAIRARSNT